MQFVRPWYKALTVNSQLLAAAAQTLEVLLPGCHGDVDVDNKEVGKAKLQRDDVAIAEVTDVECEGHVKVDGVEMSSVEMDRVTDETTPDVTEERPGVARNSKPKNGKLSPSVPSLSVDASQSLGISFGFPINDDLHPLTSTQHVDELYCDNREVTSEVNGITFGFDLPVLPEIAAEGFTSAVNASPAVCTVVSDVTADVYEGSDAGITFGFPLIPPITVDTCASKVKGQPTDAAESAALGVNDVAANAVTSQVHAGGNIGITFGFDIPEINTSSSKSVSEEINDMSALGTEEEVNEEIEEFTNSTESDVLFMMNLSDDDEGGFTPSRGASSWGSYTSPNLADDLQPDGRQDSYLHTSELDEYNNNDIQYNSTYDYDCGQYTDDVQQVDITTIYTLANVGIGLPPNVDGDERVVKPALPIKLLKRVGLSHPVDPPKVSPEAAQSAMPKLRAPLMPRWDLKDLTLPKFRTNRR